MVCSQVCRANASPQSVITLGPSETWVNRVKALERSRACWRDAAEM